jgi:4,5-dihydroxyphthalate decarboxylase
MTRPVFTLAAQAYDRFQPLFDGRVQVGGAQLNCLDLPVEETFHRMVAHGEFDVAELSLSTYVLTLSRGAPFVAVPVFPSRAFRHSAVYVPEGSSVTDPAELVGGVVGVPEYQITAAVWVRGILAEHHGLPVTSVRYRTGGLDTPGRVEKVALDLPPDVEVSPIGSTQTLSRMLADGELDAVYSARNPGTLGAGVRRLFADPPAVESAYFERTGIFPVMHVLVLRRDVHEQHPWLARELVKACEHAKQLGLAGIGETAALPYALPWLWAEAERTRAVLGEDWWPYGLERNRSTLETFLRYSHEQGLADRRYEPEELFAPASLTAVVV